MDEHVDDHDEQHPPRWVPYTPPAPDGWDRVRLMMRRWSFPVLAVLFVVGIAGAYVWTTQMETSEEGTPAINVTPAVGASEEGSGMDDAPGLAQLTLRSDPVGAAVRLNGDSIGTTPLTNRTLGSGVYMLSVQSKGYFRADTVIVLGDGANANVRLSLRPRPGTRQEAEPTPSPPTPEREQTSRPLPATSVPDEEPPPRAPVPAFGAVYVTSTPTGGVVSINGEERGRTPVGLDRLPLGSHNVTINLDGYERWTGQVSVQSDSTRRLHADLTPQTGRLRVLARPWGTIYVNGAVHARESDVWYETELPAGTHRITVVHPALGQRVEQVEVSPGEETSIVVDLQAQQ